jgi:hypothetical protein
MAIEPSRHHPRPQPLPHARSLPRPRDWSPTQRSGQNWLALCAVLFLLGTSGAVRPVQDVATGAWQAVFVPEPQKLELGQIVARLNYENARLDRGMLLRIAHAVQGCERTHGVPPRITLAVMIVESNVRPAAVSPKGAVGLMQVMPHMFEDLGLPGNVGHIESNVEAGCILLADNMRRLGEDRGISAYFWGTRIGGDAYLSKIKAVRETLHEGPPEDLLAVSAGLS